MIAVATSIQMGYLAGVCLNHTLATAHLPLDRFKPKRAKSEA